MGLFLSSMATRSGLANAAHHPNVIALVWVQFSLHYTDSWPSLKRSTCWRWCTILAPPRHHWLDQCYGECCAANIMPPHWQQLGALQQCSESSDPLSSDVYQAHQPEGSCHQCHTGNDQYKGYKNVIKTKIYGLAVQSIEKNIFSALCPNYCSKPPIQCLKTLSSGAKMPRDTLSCWASVNIAFAHSCHPPILSNRTNACQPLQSDDPGYAQQPQEPVQRALSQQCNLAWQGWLSPMHDSYWDPVTKNCCQRQD